MNACFTEHSICLVKKKKKIISALVMIINVHFPQNHNNNNKQTLKHKIHWQDTVLRLL